MKALGITKASKPNFYYIVCDNDKPTGEPREPRPPGPKKKGKKIGPH